MKRYLVSAFLISSLASTSLLALEGCDLFNKAQATSNIDTSLLDPNKTEQEFNLITDRVTALYSGTIEKLGATLVAEKAWPDKTENAFANKLGNKWLIHMYGGLFRNPDVTSDAFALVACHEIGHLIGGAPYKDHKVLMSVEGQADYWGASVCLKKYFNEYPQEVTMSEGLAKSKCDQQYAVDAEAKNNCYRGILAGLSLARYFGSNKVEPKIVETNNLEKLPYTFANHPVAQCRLNTYVSGTLCDVLDNTDKFEEKLLADNLISDFLCKDDVSGALIEKRPGCWFNEKINMVYENWQKSVKSKSIFGLKGGNIVVGFRSHFQGSHVIKIIPSTETDTAKFISMPVKEYQTELGANGALVEYNFNYSFTQKAKRELKFDIVIEYKTEEIYRQTISVKAYSLI